MCHQCSIIKHKEEIATLKEMIENLMNDMAIIKGKPCESAGEHAETNLSRK